MYLSLLVAYSIFNLFSNSKLPLRSSVLKESPQISSQIYYISSFSYSHFYSGSLFSIHFFLQNKNLQDKIHCSSYGGLKDFVLFDIAWEFCDGWPYSLSTWRVLSYQMRLSISSALCHSQSSVAQSFACYILWQDM